MTIRYTFILNFLAYETLSNKQIDMFKSSKFVSSQRTRTIEVSKFVFDSFESFFLHDDETMRNESTYDTEILSKFRQKRRKNVDSTTLNKIRCRCDRKIDSIAKKKNFAKTKN